MSKFTPEKRRELAKQGLAMPDGGYPIRNRSDLVKAIQAYGRGTNKPEIKRWIKKRAKDLHAEKYLPDNWEVEDSDELAHYGVKGMKWGVRRYQNKDGSYTNAGKKRYSSKRDTFHELSDITRKYGTSNKTKEAENRFRKLGNGRIDAGSKRLTSLARKSNADYDRYLRSWKKDWSSKETTANTVRFKKSVGRLRKEADKEAKRILGRYANRSITYAQSRDRAGQLFFASAKGRVILAQTLTELAIKNAEREPGARNQVTTDDINRRWDKETRKNAAR